MGEMQTKILGELRKIAEAEKFDFADQPMFANCGTAFVQDGFKTIVKVRYDFQGLTFTVDLGPAGADMRSNIPYASHHPEGLPLDTPVRFYGAYDDEALLSGLVAEFNIRVGLAYPPTAPDA